MPLAPAAARNRLRSLDERALLASAETFKTLSDPSRLRILHALAGGPTCVHVLCKRLRMSQPAVSHQLRLLRVSRLVSARRAGREIFYSLADHHVLSLIAAAGTHAQERR
jgi:ArsR family transcriptional regulator, lead/cadmium/zinc/bismuth-responsive transcriptional repressor